jgi:hypothetical protein
MFIYTPRMCLVWAVLMLVAFAGCGAPVKVPTSYTKWQPEGGEFFSLEYPEGWVAEGGGKNGIQWAKFKKGGCLIKCNTDVSTSLIGDIAQSANTALGGDEGLSEEELEERAPVAQAHALNAAKPKDDYSKYKEEKEATTLKSGLGDARKSVFTGTVGGRRVKGYRATFLARDRGVTVFCHCSEKDFAKMQPAFDKVLESVSRGG